MEYSDSENRIGTGAVMLVSFVATLAVLAGGAGIVANFAPPKTTAASDVLETQAVTNARSGRAELDPAFRMAQRDYVGVSEISEVDIREYRLLLDLLRAYYAANTDRQIGEAVETILEEQRHYPTLTRLECLDLLSDTVSWSFAVYTLRPPLQEQPVNSENNLTRRLGWAYRTTTIENIALVAEDIRSSLEEEALRPVYEAHERKATAKLKLNAQIAAAREAALYRGAVRNDFIEAKRQARWLHYMRTGD